MSSTLRVVADSLYIYPVKSCAPVRVEYLNFDEDGLLVADREWAVVDENASVVWQGSHPRLALIHPELRKESLVLRSITGDFVECERNALRPPRDIFIWNDTTQQNAAYPANDVGDEVAAFLQRTVGARLRLVRLGREAQRREGSNRLHIVSRTSFDELAADLPRAAQRPENLLRFRPNIVVTGWHEPLVPFMEEQFTQLEWTTGSAAAALNVRERCIRCVVPNVDPGSASEDTRILEVVGRHSATRYPGQPIYFGLYATYRGMGGLNRGTILEASLAI